MHARVVSAAQGARWLASGWRLFRVAPFGWLGATLAYWFVMSLVSLVPVVGGAAAVVLVPAFTVGFMALGRAAQHGGAVELRLLFDGFRQHARAQLVLGVIYLGAFAAVLAVSGVADGGVLAHWVLAGSRSPAPVLDPDATLAAAALAAAAYLPVMLAFWFAPPLTAWHSAAPGKALFFSFFACLMNWRAMLAYGAAAAALTLPLPFALAAGTPLFVALLVLLLPVFFASFYASYDDVFGYHLAE